jgi:F5/8 type C domain/Secretion system C-terminal sorting domain
LNIARLSSNLSNNCFAVQPQPIRIFLIICTWATLFLPACLPPSDPYPHRPPADIVAAAEAWSGDFEEYIKKWTLGQVPDQIPNNLIPEGNSDSKEFYLKNPDYVTAAETWAYRFAKPINKDSLYAGIPDPKVTYLFLGTCLAPFGSKLVIEGEFPHCRFFSIQASPPINGKEYYAQRVFGTAEVSIADADIEPLPGNTNPFRIGANRNAVNRKYRVEFDLKSGDPTALNNGAHQYPYRKNSNQRAAAMLTYQGPLGYKSIAGFDLPVKGDWNLGALWVRIYEPDDNSDALGGVQMPKVWFELPNGAKYFVGSDFSALQKRADLTIANRTVDPATVGLTGPETGWFKSWGISRSILNGICGANNWSRPDSGARVNEVDLGWTGRGEFQPAPGNIEPHATTNNYASYLGRSISVAPGMVAVLTGKLPTFPQTRNGEATMQGGQVRYWSICGIDQDPLSPLPATTIHAIADDDVVIDDQRNYIIAYSRPEDRPSNATALDGVSWVDWGRQSTHGVMMRWVCLAPEWNFLRSPHENHLDWAHSDWAGSQYDSTLIGVNWRNGFMQCYLPKVHYMSRAEFEALGNGLKAEKIPVWVDETYKTGASEALMGSMSVSSVLDGNPENAPSNLNDGNYNTGWASAFGESNATATVDLGSTKVISAVKLYWDWIFYPENYSIEVSTDETNWNTVVTATDQNGQIDLFKHLQSVKARYVRLNLTQPNSLWYRLGEFEVYTNDCDCPTPSVSTKTPPKQAAAKIQVFPNPASDVLFYKTEAGLSSNALAQVFDIAGRAKVITPLGAGKLDVSTLEPGVYFLKIGGLASVKFLVSR